MARTITFAKPIRIIAVATFAFLLVALPALFVEGQTPTPQPIQQRSQPPKQSANQIPAAWLGGTAIAKNTAAAKSTVQQAAAQRENAAFPGNPPHPSPLQAPVFPAFTGKTGPNALPVASPIARTAAAGEVIGFTSSDGSGSQIITLVHTGKLAMSVYHIDRSGTIHLVSSRPIDADFALQLNATSPLPDDIREMGKR